MRTVPISRVFLTALLVTGAAHAAPFTAKQIFATLPAQQDAACTAGYQDGKAGLETGPKFGAYLATLKGDGKVVAQGRAESGLAHFYQVCNREVRQSGKRFELPKGTSNLQDLIVYVDVRAGSRLSDEWKGQLILRNAAGKETARLDPYNSGIDEEAQDKCDDSTGKCSYLYTFVYTFTPEYMSVRAATTLAAARLDLALQGPNGRIVLPINFPALP